MEHYAGGGYQAVPPASPAGPRPYNSPPLPNRGDGQHQLHEQQQYHRQQYLQHAPPPLSQGHLQAYPPHPAHSPAALYPNYDVGPGAPEYSSIPLQTMPSAAPHAMSAVRPPPSSAHLPHATSSPSFSTFVSEHSGGHYFAGPPSPPSASQPPAQHLSPPTAFHAPVHGGSRVQRRKTMRNIQLTKGHLVVDAPVPDGVLQNAGIKTGEEFTHLRYTAATCDPNDFAAQNYTLRPAVYGRHTELFVVMTMYNEDDELFCKTMSAVTKNIAHLCTRTKSRTWGENGWQKAVVCIVADGRKKIHPRVLTCLAAMGVYQDGIAKNTVNGKEVTAHIYEYTTQIVIDRDLTIRGQDRGTVPVQIVFCLKEQNKKKLNSHRWFFNAFGPVVNPNVCVLLDVGTRPTGTSIYHLWKAFDRDPLVAGACGEIAADLGRGWSNLLNPLVATQNFEYKMSNILDKPLESMFGYISVLPGAFSAYRYTALQDTSPGVGPLSQYFKGETMHGAGAGVFEANMYLAEDRILCFELVAKKHCSWLLKYVKSAKAETDVPDTVAEFVSQRRRWLNGSFFAAAYALWKWNQIWATEHSLTRKLLLQVEFVYNTISMIFSWFALANFYLTFYFLTRPGAGESPFGSMNATYVGEILREVYLFAIIVMFICALGNRPQGSKFIYALVIFLFGVIMAVMLYIAGWTVVGQVAAVRARLQSSDGNFSFSRLSGELSSNPAFRDIVISLASTYGLYFVSSLLHLDPWHMFTSFPQYIIMLPAFVNILMVYAFCNTHDVSWGTKGDNAPKTDLGAAVMTTNKDGVQTVEVELPTEKEDINEAYDRTLRELAVRPEVKKQSRDASTKQEDYYRFFRTRLVLVWIFSNAMLVILMTLLFDQGESTSIRAPKGVSYLTIIFWSVAALSAARFFGSTAYLVNRMVFG